APRRLLVGRSQLVGLLSEVSYLWLDRGKLGRHCDARYRRADAVILLTEPGYEQGRTARRQRAALPSVGTAGLPITTAFLGAARARAATWSIQQVPSPTALNGFLSAVSCSSATACMAVGSSYAGALAERWDGERWTLTNTPRTPLGMDADTPG